MKQHHILIAALGPGDPGLLNLRTVKALQEAEDLVLRTGRHSVAEWLDQQGIAYETLDALYEEADSFDELYGRIAAQLWEKAKKTSLVYAVQDPLSDLSVQALYRLKPEHAAIGIIPGTSCTDAQIAALKPWMKDADLRIVPAYDLMRMEYNPNGNCIVSEVDNALLAGEVKTFLSEYLDDQSEIIFLRSGFSPSVIPLYMLDRQKHYDHLTAFMVPGSGFPERGRYVLEDLVRIMEKLRAPDGCPWDRAQTHLSLKPYFVEEAWECAAAVDENDMDHLSEELGDLLFQVIFHASIGKDFDEFTLGDVISRISRKMIHRHPHLFADADSTDSPPDWEQLKRTETGRDTVVDSLEDVAPGLPSIKYASKIYSKLGRIGGFRREPEEIIREIRSLLDQMQSGGDTGDEKLLGSLLLRVTELCQSRGADGEMLLHEAADRLKEGIRKAETLIKNDGKSIESLTFRELGVYLSHVEGVIE